MEFLWKPEAELHRGIYPGRSTITAYTPLSLSNGVLEDSDEGSPLKQVTPWGTLYKNGDRRKWEATVNEELKMRATPKMKSPVVCKLPPGTKVRVTAESQLEDGTRRAKVWHYDADGQIKRGWVSWIGKDNRHLLSEAVSPPTTPFGSKNTTPANSPPSMRPPSRRNGSSPYSSPTTSPPSTRPPSQRPNTNSPPSMRPLSASPSSLRKGGGSAIDGIKEEGEEERSSSNLSYRSGWSLQSEELRQKLLLASLNSPRSYRSEDTLPPEVALSGSVATGQKLPVTASFKNRSDRRLHRLTHAINSAKDEIAAAESFSHAQAATPHNRRRSREAAPESFSHPLPDQKQRQHVMRLRVWRSMKLPLHKVNKRTLDVHYNILNDSFSKRMGALEA